MDVPHAIMWRIIRAEMVCQTLRHPIVPTAIPKTFRPHPIFTQPRERDQISED